MSLNFTWHKECSSTNSRLGVVSEWHAEARSRSLCLCPSSSLQGRQLTHSENHTASPAMNQCIDDCHACATICNATLIHCLNLGSAHSAPRHIALLLDCAAVCEAAVASMSRSSVVHRDICRACAAICRACEFECRRMGHGEVLQRCAEACRKCAESCDRMAAA